MVCSVLVIALAISHALTVALVFITFGVPRVHHFASDDVKFRDETRRANIVRRVTTTTSVKPRHADAVSRLVDLVSGHQDATRQKNRSAKTADELVEHDVEDLARLIRKTVAATGSGSGSGSGMTDSENDDEEDERTSLLQRPAAGLGKRERRRYRPLSARNVLTLTRLTRLMKGGGDGGAKGLASNQLPHVGDVLAAIDRMTSKRIDDDNLDDVTTTNNSAETATDEDEASGRRDRRKKYQKAHRRSKKLNARKGGERSTQQAADFDIKHGRAATLPALEPNPEAWKIPFWSRNFDAALVPEGEDRRHRSTSGRKVSPPKASQLNANSVGGLDMRRHVKPRAVMDTLGGPLKMRSAPPSVSLHRPTGEPPSSPASVGRNYARSETEAHSRTVGTDTGLSSASVKAASGRSSTTGLPVSVAAGTGTGTGPVPQSSRSSVINS